MIICIRPGYASPARLRLSGQATPVRIAQPTPLENTAILLLHLCSGAKDKINRPYFLLKWSGLRPAPGRPKACTFPHPSAPKGGRGVGVRLPLYTGYTVTARKGRAVVFCTASGRKISTAKPGPLRHRPHRMKKAP